MDETVLRKIYDATKNELIQDRCYEFNFDLNNFIITELVKNCSNRDDRHYIVLDKNNRMNMYKFIYLLKEFTAKYCDNILKNIEDECNDLNELKFSNRIDNIHINNSESGAKITFCTNPPVSFNEFKEMSLEDLPECIFKPITRMTNE